MKRSCLALLISFLCLCGPLVHVSLASDLKSQALSKLAADFVKDLPADSKISRLAVLDFKNDDGSVRNALTAAITAKTSFRVMERADLDRILEEQGLQLRDIMDEKTIIQHGMLKGVQGLLMGKLSGAEEGFMSYSVRVQAKLVDVERGEIIFTKDYAATAASPYRIWVFLVPVVILGLIILGRLKGKKKADDTEKLIKEDVKARISLAKEVDKIVTNLSDARSRLNSQGRKDEAVILNNLEGDVLHLKQVVQTASRSSAYARKPDDHARVLEFDQAILAAFRGLTAASDALYDRVFSGSEGINQDADELKRHIKNVLNAFRDRGF